MISTQIPKQKASALETLYGPSCHSLTKEPTSWLITIQHCTLPFSLYYTLRVSCINRKDLPPIGIGWDHWWVLASLCTPDGLAIKDLEHHLHHIVLCSRPSFLWVNYSHLLFFTSFPHTLFKKHLLPTHLSTPVPGSNSKVPLCLSRVHWAAGYLDILAVSAPRL